MGQRESSETSLRRRLLNSFTQKKKNFMKLSYSLEDKFGISMQYYISKAMCEPYVNSERRSTLKLNNLEKIKKMVITGEWGVDDCISNCNGHTLLHEAIILDKEEAFKFLVRQDAHLMMRDYNGYTPLLKAASTGRLFMVKTLIEKGVDPNHVDPWGNTPLDKAQLHGHIHVANYLKELPEDCNKGMNEYWKTKAPSVILT